jgi:hypothetical protein
LWCHALRVPFTPEALLNALAEDTVTGGQKWKQLFAFVHLGWLLLSPVR